MKIAIATGPWLPVPTIQGGAHHRLWQGLAEEFAAAGHKVTILCRSYPGQPDTEIINGVEYVRRGGFSQSPNIWFDLLKDLIYSLLIFPTLPQSDILVINDFWLPVFAPLRSKVGKIIVSVGRFPKGQYPLYRYVDMFTVLSEAIWKGIAQQYPDAIPRMRLIPNPVDTQVFYPPDQPKIERAEKVILYVGRLHPEKGLHLLLDAFSLLSTEIPQVKLRIVGPKQGSQGGGGEGYFNQLKSKAKGLNVEFIEPIFDTKQLAEIYRDADLFCYPSLAEKGEAFPIAPLEAMGCGIIPVVSDLSCFKDYIEDGKTGYFFEHRSLNAAQNLATILAKNIYLSPENIRKMKDETSKKAAKYSYDNIASLYLSNFKKLLDSSS